MKHDKVLIHILKIAKKINMNFGPPMSTSGNYDFFFLNWSLNRIVKLRYLNPILTEFKAYNFSILSKWLELLCGTILAPI